MESRLDCFVEFVRGSGRPGAAQVFIPVVDPAVVDQPVMCVEDRRFRRNLCLRLRDQRMLRIAQRGELVAILAFMLSNFFRRSGLAKINKPKARLARVLAADTLNQRRITVGDGAVRAHEYEHNRLSRGLLKRIGGTPIEMKRRLLRGLRKRKSQKNSPSD